MVFDIVIVVVVWPLALVVITKEDVEIVEPVAVMSCTPGRASVLVVWLVL